MSEVLVESRGSGVRLVTLHRPQARNALLTSMQHQLDQHLAQLRDDDAVRAVVITGAGDKAFCAGYDIRELEALDEAGTLANYALRRPLIWNVAAFPKPLIGAINGSAHGAGAIIAVACDMRVGSPLTQFRFTAAAYGGVNNTWHLPRVVGLSRALEYTMTARRVGGTEAFQAGLLNHLVPPEQVLETALDIATQIAAHPPRGVQWHKRLIHDNHDRSVEQAYAAENEWMLSTYRPGRPEDLFRDVLPPRK